MRQPCNIFPTFDSVTCGFWNVTTVVVIIITALLSVSLMNFLVFLSNVIHNFEPLPVCIRMSIFVPKPCSPSHITLSV